MIPCTDEVEPGTKKHHWICSLLGRQHGALQASLHRADAPPPNDTNGEMSEDLTSPHDT